MSNCLCFICPTDFLEDTINKEFNRKHYYYTSLGNSVVFNKATVMQIKSLIEKQNIKEISFVLSSDNRILLDALGEQQFSDITGLNRFYNTITNTNTNTSLAIYDDELSIFSSYLNDKMVELQIKLYCLDFQEVSINGKIYHRKENRFDSTDPNVLWKRYMSFN